ncbi:MULTISPECIES: hypothetical protein [Breznakia]|uniref:Uncharacterized protein n=1 Tax=Breznakia blatticola TaxID=1754012 RepID=A0A4R7Z883_9FIRM|nr:MULTISPECIES: hypothetical protein [Breznakia]MDH6367833.1 transcriptional regulator of NAD metabolism [Breznakia sp. PH1-1]MDH6404920.1 transcriptional regulator of NAD metabolism [Breznakia sp. PF1-11]MDH6412636.1 transcriptional regulator of NAD metabolism [Breznakia sp. PFB1-11]MDH6414995.1 transcriptional regulator of NAD metabolism [Breznakia sp. PFB1-14]MDH6417306.1 transcriptional regulator of NAD metabolism [Breznakia sp. PFB1-4]
MKHVIMLKDMKTKEDRARVTEDLNDLGIEHSFDVEQKTLAINDRGDAVRNATRILSENGFLTY